MDIVLSPPLPLEQIERRLAAPPPGPSEPGAPPEAGTATRAFTLNLICRARNAADADGALAELLALAPRHPARILLLVEGEPAPRGFLARVAPAAGVAGRSEVVSFTLAASHLPAAASLVAPLLIGDLPVVLWWRAGNPANAPDFEALAALADRVLLDGVRCDMNVSLLAQLHARLRGRAHALADFTWTRLTPWRQLLHQAVESWPSTGAAGAAPAALLARIGAIRLVVTGSMPAGDNLAALLLTGWVAHQLGWTPAPLRRLAADDPAGLLLLRSDRTPVRVTLLRGGAGGRAAMLERVEIHDAAGAPLLVLRRSGEGLRLELPGAGLAASGVWKEPPQPGSRAECALLSQELSFTGHDRMFEGALASAAAIGAVLEVQAA